VAAAAETSLLLLLLQRGCVPSLITWVGAAWVIWRGNWSLRGRGEKEGGVSQSSALWWAALPAIDVFSGIWAADRSVIVKGILSHSAAGEKPHSSNVCSNSSA